MEQADAYKTALADGQRFRIHGNRLEILDGGRRTTLVFSRQPPLPGKQLDLVRTQWRRIGNDRPFILAFLDDKVVVAIVGECVHYTAGYRTTGRLLDLYYVLRHHFRMKCSGRESIDLLWDAQQYAVIEEEGLEKLLIGSRLGGTLTLNALPARAPDSNQGEWTLTSIADLTSDDIGDNYIMETIPGSTVAVSFQEDHISGSAGCNSYQASLKVVGNAITIGPTSATELACDDLDSSNDVMDQESRYLDLLPKVTRVLVIADRLFLSAGTGIYLIFEAK